MIQAIFGLIGVIVGGLVTAGFQQLAQKRERKRAERLAARVLLDEFGWWRSVLTHAIAVEDVSTLDAPATVAVAWGVHREALVGLPKDEWRRLHLSVRVADTDYSLTAGSLPTGTPMDEGLAAGLQEQVRRIGEAEQILGKYV